MLDPVLFGSGPSFDRDQLANDVLINRYVTDGLLPRDVPVSIIQSWSGRYPFMSCDEDLFINSHTPLKVALC